MWVVMAKSWMWNITELKEAIMPEKSVSGTKTGEKDDMGHPHFLWFLQVAELITCLQSWMWT